MESQKVIFEKWSEELELPKAGTQGAACWDLRADDDYFLHGYGVVGTGLKVRIPDGHVGLVCSRSGLAANHGIFVLNAPGVIDADYRGEVKIILGSVMGEFFKITQGERVAQLMVLPLPTMEAAFGSVTESETARGANGFGSTGKH